MDGENYTDPDTRGCFQWVLRTGRTLNERWAKSRNNLRERFHRNHPERPPMRVTDHLNDTGTPDMELIRIPLTPRDPWLGPPNFIYKGNHPGHLQRGPSREELHGPRSPRELREIHSENVLTPGTRHITTPITERAVQDMGDLVRNYVDDVIHKAEDVVNTDTGCGDIVQAVKEEEVTDSDSFVVISCDSAHASHSSISVNISEAADAAVNYMLDNLSLDDCDYHGDDEDNGN